MQRLERRPNHQTCRAQIRTLREQPGPTVQREVQPSTTRTTQRPSSISWTMAEYSNHGRPSVSVPSHVPNSYTFCNPPDVDAHPSTHEWRSSTRSDHDAPSADLSTADPTTSYANCPYLPSSLNTTGNSWLSSRRGHRPNAYRFAGSIWHRDGARCWT